MSNQETVFKPEVTASEIIESNMDKYARYALLELVPNYVDGLKLIHRRILLALGTTENKMKGSALVGRVMSKYHPHGDASIYDAIMRLAQPFNQIHPLVQVEGNVGDYSGEPFAAARYTDILSAEFSRDIFFNRVNFKTLTYIPSETGVGTEVAYFIPILPMALLTGTYTVAVGVKSVIPYLEFSNVCSLVEKFVSLRKANPLTYEKHFPSLAKYLIPDAPSHSLLCNAKELLKAYEVGNFTKPIIMDGIIDIHPDSINIRTIPYNRKFKEVLSKLGDMFKTANFVSGTFQEISDISTGFEYGNIKLPVKRGLDPFAVIDNLKRLIGFRSKQTYLWNFTNMNGTLLPMNPYDILVKWYDMRCRSILGDLKYSRDDLFKQYRRLMALIIVADHTDEVLTIFKQADNREATIEPLCSQFQLTENQAQYLASLQMHQITKQGKDALLKELDGVKDRIKNLQTKFSDIDNIIVSDVDYVKNKYKESTKRKLKYPVFMGAVKINDSGYIQYESIDELAKLERRWTRNKLEIIPYPKGVYNLTLKIGDRLETDGVLAHPKEFVAQDIYVYKNIPKHTIHFGNGYIHRTSHFLFGEELGRKNLPVYEQFIALDSKFKLLQYRATQVGKRTNIDAEGVKTDLIYVSDVFGDNAVVVLVNENNPNQIIFELVEVGQKMNYPGIGKIHIYGIFSLNDVVALNILPKHSYRCSIKYLYFSEIGKLFNGECRVICYLNTKKMSNNIRIQPLTNQSYIWTCK